MGKTFAILGCGLICVALGYISLWLGILAVPILYSFAGSLRRGH